MSLPVVDFLESNIVGGAIAGPNEFVSRSTQAAWVAVYTFFIVWFIHVLLIPLLRRYYQKMDRAGTSNATGSSGKTRNLVRCSQRLIGLLSSFKPTLKIPNLNAK